LAQYSVDPFLREANRVGANAIRCLRVAVAHGVEIMKKKADWYGDSFCPLKFPAVLFEQHLINVGFLIILT
jgi:hypothetical protein